MAESTCPNCLRPSERKLFCYTCLPPLCEWESKRKYHAHYQMLYRMAGLHSAGSFPSSRLPDDHPARPTPTSARGTCRHCGQPAEWFVCTECQRAQARAWRRAWRKTDKGKAYKQRHPGRRGTKVVEYLRSRDGDRCSLCGKRMDFTIPAGDGDSVTVDHVVPRYHGGSNDYSNLRLAHHRCNSSKGTAPSEEQLMLVG